MKKLILSIFLFSYLLGFGQQPYSQKFTDLNYVNDGQNYHCLDIYLPNIVKNTYPVVVAIYGSAWLSNSGKSLNGIGNALLNAGYAIVTPNHRSSKDAKFPAQIQDIKAVVRYIRGNCSQFKLDTTFIGITGESSGGHLAALCGTTNSVKQHTIGKVTMDIEGSLGQYVSFSSKVDAICDWFGPTDFLAMDSCFVNTNIHGMFKHNENNSPESSLIGEPIQNSKTRCSLANPITYVNPTNPPFLLIHGDMDNLVPYCQSSLLYTALQSSRVPSKFILAAGGGHMNSKTETKENILEMIKFFNNVSTQNQYK
jgi:acetyl esterase/lipase